MFFFIEVMQCKVVHTQLHAVITQKSGAFIAFFEANPPWCLEMYGPSIQCPVSQKAVQHQTTFAENSSRSRDSIKIWIAAFIASLVSLTSQHILIYCKGLYVFKCVSSTVQHFQYDIHNVYICIYISNHVCIYMLDTYSSLTCYCF